MATSASPGLSDHTRAMLIDVAGLAIIVLGVGPRGFRPPTA